jgi:hypothetical protein
MRFMKKWEESFGNASYWSVRKLLSTHTVPKTLDIMKYKLILTTALYESEMWSPILRDGHKLQTFELTNSMEQSPSWEAKSTLS